jgi:penicillin-insensitive murein DD-endopeptidase
MPLRRLALALLAFAALALGSAPGAAAKPHAGKKGAQSIGPPNAGRLTGASRLRGSRYLKQRENAHSWGLPALVRALGRAAAIVARKHHGSVLLVGDLSGRTGGPLEGHGSHQSGRDADVGFYVMNSRGKPVNVKHFVAFDGNGKGRELPWAVFDDARNWDLVEALLSDEKANVRYLFVTNGLRARLLAQAAKKHATKEMIARAAAAMMSPTDADLHDDHFHVRIACPESMRDVCVEEATPRGGGEKAARTDAADAPAADAKPVADAKAADAKPADGAQ